MYKVHHVGVILSSHNSKKLVSDAFYTCALIIHLTLALGWGLRHPPSVQRR